MATTQKQLNPFKRVTEKPVVFWSGIVDADTTAREVIYNVPDYFNGTLTVMAVAVADDATGAAERDALIRGPFVITPSVPGPGRARRRFRGRRDGREQRRGFRRKRRGADPGRNARSMSRS